MRLEDKELEGPELEREQRLETLESETLHGERDKELPEHAGPEVQDLELEHRSRVLDAVQGILARQNLSIPMLYLPQRETRALEALQAAVDGRDRSMNTFVFAEDRGALLEQALAVLQQNLTQGDAGTLAALHSKYEELVGNVAELRDELYGLEDAQDDLLDLDEHQIKSRRGAPDTTDDDVEPDSVTGFIASALNALASVAQVEGEQPFRSTLVGPDLPEVEKAPSTLEGPELKVEARTSSLGGDPLPEKPAHRSVLDAPGPEVPDKQDHVSMLDGPEIAEPEKRSQLYTEGMSALIVPEHLRPRVAAHQPTGMRTDGLAAPEREAHVDDGRGPAPPSTAAALKKAQDYEPPTTSRTPTRDSKRSMEQAPLAKPGTSAAKHEDEPPSRPTPKPRGLSARTSEKPRKK